MFMLGDFTRCDISKQLPTLHQYVSCPTWIDETLHMYFGNIPDVFPGVAPPPLGRSDNNMVHLLPKYRQKLKQEPSQVHTIKHWTPDSAETLRGCLRKLTGMSSLTVVNLTRMH